MSALRMDFNNVIPFSLPKKPKVIQKEEIPFKKSYCVTPYRAAADKNLHEGTLRVLMMLCSYTNRAGITWVGQATIGKHLGISKQAVNKQMKLLIQHGYIQVVSKGFRGERANTTRIIFDETVSTEDAISIVSAQEDARPPYLIKKEQQDMSKEIEKKLSELPKLDGMSKPKRAKIKPTDSITVRQMKKVINEKMDKDEARTKRLKTSVKDVVKPVDKSVDNSLHSQPHSQPLGVDREVIEGSISNNIYINNNKELINKLLNIYKNVINNKFKVERVLTEQDVNAMTVMVEAGLDEQLWKDVLEDILETMKAKRQEPPHRISYFKDGILKALA